VSPGEIEVAPKTLLEPDLLVFPSTYAPGTAWRRIGGWWLAAEVFSPSSRMYDRAYKRDAYLSLGVREVWLVDLDERAIFVSRRGEAGRDVRHGAELRWAPEELREPLVIDVPSLFDGLP
jgi:Uma2 family endonuclease